MLTHAISAAYPLRIKLPFALWNSARTCPSLTFPGSDAGTMVSFYFLATCLAGFVSVQGQSTSSFNPARPPAIPLAVKSPYLNAWLNAGSDGGNGGYLAGQWPVHWRYVEHIP